MRVPCRECGYPAVREVMLVDIVLARLNFRQVERYVERLREQCLMDSRHTREFWGAPVERSDVTPGSSRSSAKEDTQ
jgi:hypothetical protein